MKTADWNFDLNRPKPTPTVRVSFDLETALIAPCVQAPPVIAMGFSVDGGKVQVVSASDPSFDRVVEFLVSDPDVRLFGHNVRFDLCALLAHGAKWGLSHWPAMIFSALAEDRVTCTMLREKLLTIALANPRDTGRKFDLGTCCERAKTPTQPDKSDPWRLKWGTLAHLPVAGYPAEATRYLVEDVQACDELYRHQASRPEWLIDQYRQTRASVALSLMSAWGMATDPEVVARVHAETVADLEMARRLCEAHGLVRPNGVKDKRAAEARCVTAYAALGQAAPRGEPTERMQYLGHEGNIRLDEETCLKSKDPVLKAFTKLTQAQALLAKVERLKHPIIQPHFDPLKETGRTGCSQGKDPRPGEAPSSHPSQTQNLPRGVLYVCRACAGVGCEHCKGKGEVEGTGLRECFRARPGRVCLDADYSMAELVALSQIEYAWFGTSALGEVLKDPKRDVHVEIGGAAMGLAPEAAYALKRTEPKRFKEMRQLGKAISFGAPGGLGHKRFVDFALGTYGVTLTEDQAKEILTMVKRIYPERAAYLKRVGDWAGGFGEKVRFRLTHFYSQRVRGGLGYTDGANTSFQGLASDVAKEGLWRIAVACYVLTDSPLYGARPVNFVHDQVLCEVDEANYREAAVALETLWVGAANDIMPDTRMRSEVAAWRNWTKAAGDAVYWADGTLAVYEDWQKAGGTPKNPRPAKPPTD